MLLTEHLMVKVCGTLAIVLGLEFLYLQVFVDGSLVELSEVDAALEIQQELPQVSSRKDLNYRVITEQPLFDPLRKPVTSNALMDSSLVVDNWRLTGVIKTEERAQVMFDALDGSRFLTLDEGMFLNRWKITSVSEDRVTLESAEEIIEMVLPVNLESNRSGKPQGQAIIKSPKNKNGANTDVKQLNSEKSSKQQTAGVLANDIDRENVQPKKTVVEAKK